MAKFAPMKRPMQFLSLPNAAPADADVLILPVPHEQTVTYKAGTANGPEAILAASEQLEFFEEDMAWCPLQHMKLTVLPTVEAIEHEAEEAFHRRLFETAEQLPAKPLLIALGGEHSITPEMLFARLPAGGTVVHIDAHADLRPRYHGSIYNHACPMYRIRARGYRLIQIGIRSLHANEAAQIESDDGITVWFDRALQRPGVWQQLLDQLASLSGPVWLSIDMDGFDPALITGVGTPQPGGLSWHQGLDLLQALTANRAVDLRNIDIVELVPEPGRVSEMMAAKLVQKCISYWGKSQGFDQRLTQGSQIGADDE
ncbi:MAG: agmatinase [Gammaproteobacteria bacterium]|nr:agmatinase [Gammaproteobacteria bacterium]